MISDWRGDRRIGPPLPSERLSAWLRILGVTLVTCVGSGTFIVLASLIPGMFTDFQTLRSRVLLWSIGCATAGAVMALEYLRRRRATDAAATLVLSITVALLASRFTVPALVALGWVEVIYVPPVAS